MNQLLEQPVEERQDTDESTVYHHACPRCCGPLFRPGMRAVCGYVGKGIPVPNGKPRDCCVVCADLIDHHLEECLSR